MIVRFSKHFLQSYFKAPKPAQKAFDKQSEFLLLDLHHPSLRTKKYDEARDLWQARVNYSWRFYFKIAGDVYLIPEARRHIRVRNCAAIVTMDAHGNSLHADVEKATGEKLAELQNAQRPREIAHLSTAGDTEVQGPRPRPS
jgi:mRNA interferase RelE/StbE